MDIQKMLEELNNELKKTKTQSESLTKTIKDKKKEWKIKDPEPPKVISKDCVLKANPNFTMYKNERWLDSSQK